MEKQKKVFCHHKNEKKKLKILFANLNFLFLLTDQSIIQKKKKMSRENKMKIKMEPTEVNEDFPKKIKLEEIDLKHSQFDEKVKKEPTLFCDLLDEPQTQRFDEISGKLRGLKQSNYDLKKNNAVLSKKLKLSEKENQKLSQKFQELDQKLDQKFKKMKNEKIGLEKKLQEMNNSSKFFREYKNLKRKMSFLKKENLLLKKKKKKKVAIKAAKKAAKELDKKVDQNLKKQGRKGIKIENAKV